MPCERSANPAAGLCNPAPRPCLECVMPISYRTSLFTPPNTYGRREREETKDAQSLRDHCRARPLAVFVTPRVWVGKAIHSPIAATVRRAELRVSYGRASTALPQWLCAVARGADALIRQRDEMKGEKGESLCVRGCFARK